MGRVNSELEGSGSRAVQKRNFLSIMGPIQPANVTYGRVAFLNVGIMAAPRLLAILIGVGSIVSIAAAQSGSLTEIYRTGRVKLVEEVRVSDEALPRDAGFQNPRGIAIDAQGRIYVADAGAEHLKVFGPDGKFVRTIGRKGQGPGEFQGPEFVEIGSSRIFVWEAMNRRISIFDAEGKFLASAPFSPGSFGVFIRMSVLPDGRLIVHYERGLSSGVEDRVPDRQTHVIELLSPDARAPRTLLEKEVKSSRLVWNPEYNANVRVPFPYHPTLNMEVTTAGVLAVGYSEKYMLEIHSPDKGRSGAFVRPYSPIRLSEKDEQDHFGRFRMTVFKDGLKTILPKAPEVILKNTEFPEKLPPYRGIIADGEGRFLVQVYVESRATNIFDVFDPKDGFVSRITVDGADIDHSFSVSLSNRFSGRYLWRIERDEEGYASLVKYRLTAAR